jgi:Glycosyl hydrolase family 63 C-terminal domain
VNINYLTLKALKRYGTAVLTLETVKLELEKSDRNMPSKTTKKGKKHTENIIKRSTKILSDYNIQKERSLELYHKLRNNIQNSVLTTYHETGFLWEHYEDLKGRGTRGHPFSGWTSLIVNIMAEI